MDCRSIGEREKLLDAVSGCSLVVVKSVKPTTLVLEVGPSLTKVPAEIRARREDVLVWRG